MSTSYGGGDPHPGPGTTSGFGGFGGGFADGGGGDGGGLPGGIANGRGNGTSDTALIDYLVANRGTANWIVAANSAQEAGTIELETGLPVMAMGGFTGSDPAPSLDQLKSYISSGKLRFVMSGGGGFGGFGGGGFGGISDTASRTAWVSANCSLVSVPGSNSSSLYDCAGAA